MASAVVLIDIQNDFCEGGNLAVPNGSQVVNVANKYLLQGHINIATQDWHPKNHKSFASQHQGYKAGDVIDLYGVKQILWPDHSVQNTFGANLHKDLLIDKIDYIQQKGTNPNIDSYSAFFENDKKTKTGLDQYLKNKNISRLIVMGLATDYCVLYSVIDALKLGYQVQVIQSGCRGIDLKTNDVDNAFLAMKKAGAELA